VLSEANCKCCVHLPSFLLDISTLAVYDHHLACLRSGTAYRSRHTKYPSLSKFQLFSFSY